MINLACILRRARGSTPTHQSIGCSPWSLKKRSARSWLRHAVTSRSVITEPGAGVGGRAMPELLAQAPMGGGYTYAGGGAVGIMTYMGDQLSVLFYEESGDGLEYSKPSLSPPLQLQRLPGVSGNGDGEEGKGPWGTPVHKKILTEKLRKICPS